MNVLIVDDEMPARERLCYLLEQIGGYTVCGQASNGAEAVRLARELDPDIVLLDIRMPEVDGIDAARDLMALDRPPAIIFTTAYEEHALEAFEVDADGYLLKPVRIKHLEQSLSRAQRPNRAQLALLDRGEPQHGSEEQRLHLQARLGYRLELIPIDDVIYLQAQQKYVLVRHLHGQVLIEESLRSLENEFSQRFLRIHRNALVAMHRVAGIEKSADGRTLVFFHDIDVQLEVSRRHAAAVRRFLTK